MKDIFLYSAPCPETKYSVRSAEMAGSWWWWSGGLGDDLVLNIKNVSLCASWYGASGHLSNGNSQLRDCKCDRYGCQQKGTKNLETAHATRGTVSVRWQNMPLPTTTGPKIIGSQAGVGKEETWLFPQTIPTQPPEYVQASPTTADILILVLAANLTFWIKEYPLGILNQTKYSLGSTLWLGLSQMQGSDGKGVLTLEKDKTQGPKWSSQMQTREVVKNVILRL